MSTLRFLIAVLFLCSPTILSQADVPNQPLEAQKPPLLVPTPTGALAAGREALIDRSYEQAAQLLGAAAMQVNNADEALLLQGHAHFNRQEYSEAITSYQALLQKFPQSSWAKKAAFKKADAHFALGQFAEAAAIYQPQLRYITSDERRETVAVTYLKYAGQYFDPPRNEKGEQPKPNYARAKALYLKALEIGLTPARTAGVLLQVALSDFHAGNFAAAIQGFERVIQEHPKNEAAAEALYYSGLAHSKQNQMPQARRNLRDFLADYPQHTKRAEATFAIAETYRVPSPQNDRDLELGVAALRDFVAQFPQHEKALQAEYWIGFSYFNRARHEDAVREFVAFLEKHPQSDADEAAMTKYYLGESYLGQKQFRAAIEVWERFLREHPVHRLSNEVQRKVIDTEYSIGEEAYKDEKYAEAQAAWAVFQQKYPLDVRNADIMFRVGMIHYDAKEYSEAIEQWRRVISKYGSTEAASRAQYMIALTHEKLGDWDEALAALKLVEGQWKAEAQKRLATLQEKRLVVFTERAFTTADQPSLKLVTRNVPRVEMRVYGVNMADYFARTHTMRGVENLDLALIAPDQTLTLDIPEYSDYREIETQMPLPFKTAGVYAVVTRALDQETKAGETTSTPAAGNATSAGNPASLEATSVVFITNLGLITKATQNDIFVLAQDRVTQQPAPDTSVIISDGSRFVARGKTDRNGVFHYLRPPAKAGADTDKDKVDFPANAVRVLGQEQGNYAATEGNLSELAPVQPLRASGLLYSERPLYRPGQAVHLKGIVRQVQDGDYSFEQGAEYALTVAAPTGESVFSRRVRLNEFGTFSENFDLPDETPVGLYRMTLTRPQPDKTETPLQPVNVAGAFQVAVYQLDKIRLHIELPKNVYLRGEEIEGKVRAEYYYGEPLRKRKIRFGWGNRPGDEYETDDKGEFTFKIPTRRFDEEAAVGLWARLEAEGVQARTTAYVAVVGVNASLSTLREVYLAGERFEVKISAQDLAEKPFAGAFTLRVLRQIKTEGGHIGEREVEVKTARTNADGSETVALALETAGDYILRLEGRDAAGNPVTTERAIQVVGEDEPQRLRILSDTDTLPAGATQSIRVLWRGAKEEKEENEAANNEDRLALVTYEGDRIFGHQLVRLQRGENTIRVPVETKLAPVFRLSIALMDGDDFHQAAKWFAVERELKVQVVATRADGSVLKEGETIKPGEQVRVQIETRDQTGAPMAAELSLAAIDEALFSAASFQPAPMKTLAGGRLPTDNPVLTTASNTFNYTAEARREILQVRAAEDFTRNMLAAQAAEYPDVPLGHWVYAALDRLNRAGVVEGLPSGAYAGNKPLTRYEVAVAVARVMDKLPQGASRSSAISSQAELGDAFDALAREFRSELGDMGVKSDALENRVATLERRVAAPPRTQFEPSVQHRSGYFSQGATRFYNGVTPNQPGIRVGESGPFGAQGAPGILGLQGPSGSPGRDILNGNVAVAQGLVIDPQNALMVQSGEAEAALRQFAETAFWNAHIATDADGKAQIEFVLPGSLTEWRLVGRGVTRATHLGEASEKFVARQPFWVELQAPPVLQSGDRASVTAIVHNGSGEKVQAKVSLATAFDGATATPQTQTVEVGGDAAEEVRFELDVPSARVANLKLQADAGALKDGVEEKLEVRAWGIDRVVSAGGLAEADRSVEIELPDAEYSARRLTVTVGPDTPTALLALAERGGAFAGVQSLTESNVQRLLAVTAAQGYLKASGGGEQNPRYRRLSDETDGLITRLASSQAQDGGWSWALPVSQLARSKGNVSRSGDLVVTAYAVAALSSARSLGHEIPESTMEKALAYLAQSFQRSGSADNDGKAIILWAQSIAGVADFAHVNRLYRLRDSLSARNLALLSLTLAKMERDVMARDVVDLLTARTSTEALRAAAAGQTMEAAAMALNVNAVDDVALAALAMAQVEPQNALLPEMAKLIWAKRRGRVWSTPPATSHALAALFQHARTETIRPENYTLAVAVNDQVVERINVNADAVTTVLDIAPALLTAPRAKISFDIEGRGTYAYSAVLTGFSREGLMDDKTFEQMSGSQTSPDTILSSGPLRVRRNYQPAPLMWEGKIVPRGFSTVSNTQSWQNVANEVPVGEHVQVSLTWNQWRRDANDKVVVEDIVLREPLPAGARVLEDTIGGNFERYEIGEGEIVFYFTGRTYGQVSYNLYGAQPGNYRVLPAKIQVFNRPDLYAYSTYKDFRVLPRGAKTSDEYRITPDEIFHLAKWRFERAQAAWRRDEEPNAEDLKIANEYLLDLFNRDADPKGWKLNDSTAREVSRILFTLALHREDAPATVRYFEVLRERFPDIVIPFAEIVQTAHAYGVIGEREREVQVLRNTAEASFRREAAVAGTLAEEGEHRASYEYLAERTQEYPDLANVESAVYTLAQTIAQRAAEVGKDTTSETAKTQSRELGRLAAATLRDFLTLYAENPASAEASFAFAVNLIEQERFAEAVTWADRSRKRYPQSAYLDDYDYIGSYASFLAEDYDGAVATAQRLATTEYPVANGEDGETAPSPYRPFALYIAAQIFHARGETGQAMEYYQQVSAQFPDAREAADFFGHKSLKMPEVTTVDAREPVTLKVQARNVAQAEVAVYKVDLLQFYRDRRNLMDLANMNLSGIAPAWQGEVEFGDREYSDVEKTLTLPLAETGAYFVTIKAINDANQPSVSGVVVRSDLGMAVQEDPVSGRVRVNVVRENGGEAPVLQPKAEVWVVGSADGTFRKGTTDLRGLVAVDDVKGLATVIAVKDGAYAFYRGETVLQPQNIPAAAVASPRQSTPNQPVGQKKGEFKDQARDAYMTNNQAIINRNFDELQSVMKAGRGESGLAAGKAY